MRCGLELIPMDKGYTEGLVNNNRVNSPYFSIHGTSNAGGISCHRYHRLNAWRQRPTSVAFVMSGYLQFSIIYFYGNAHH